MPFCTYFGWHMRLNSKANADLCKLKTVTKSSTNSEIAGCQTVLRFRDAPIWSSAA
jgi:hypothetical protein